LPHPNPADAVDAFLHDLRRCLACVTRDGIVRNQDSAKPGQDHSVTLRSSSAPVKVEARRGGATKLALRVALLYRVAPHLTDWAVYIVSYHYGLLDVDEKEILVYHWHPQVQGFVTPHLHVGPGAKAERTELRKAHLPTGRVSLKDFVSLLIREFGVQTLREDWKDVLGPTALGEGP